VRHDRWREFATDACDVLRRNEMTSFKPLAAAALLSVVAAAPVLAQAAIQELAAFAFYRRRA